MPAVQATRATLSHSQPQSRGDAISTQCQFIPFSFTRRVCHTVQESGKAASGAQPLLLEANELVLADRDVIQHVTIEQLASLSELHCRFHIFWRGRWVAGGVVVCHDDGGTGAHDGWTEDLRSTNRAAGHGSLVDEVLMHEEVATFGRFAAGHSPTRRDADEPSCRACAIELEALPSRLPRRPRAHAQGRPYLVLNQAATPALARPV